MLEDCAGLSECENLLTDSIEHIQLLGEIPLTTEDMDKLSEMVQKTIASSISKGTQDLKKKYPVSFACFLVGMGRFYDKENGYWPILEQRIGAIDSNWKNIWGRIFLQFLQQRSLSEFNEEMGLAYVTPILGHAGIPEDCLDEFFERIVFPLVYRDLFNPLDQEEVIHDLRTRRKNNNHRLVQEQEIEKQCLKVDEQITRIRNLQAQLDALEAVSILLTKEKDYELKQNLIAGLDEAKTERENFEEIIKAKKEEINKLRKEDKDLKTGILKFKKRFKLYLDNQSRIEGLTSRYRRLQEEIFNAQDREKEQLRSVIYQWAQLSQVSWNEKFGSSIREVPIEKILAKVEQFKNLEEKQVGAQERIASLKSTQTKRRRKSRLLRTVLILIDMVRNRIVRKKRIQKPNELEILQIDFHARQSKLKNKKAALEKMFVDLPIRTQLFDSPNFEFYKKIRNFQLAYNRYLEVQENHKGINDEKRFLTDEISDLSSELGVLTDKNLQGQLDIINNRLEEALLDKDTQLISYQKLKNEIQPSMQALCLEIENLRVDLQKLDSKLIELGEGSLERGVALDSEIRSAHAEINILRQELTSSVFDFQNLEGELREQGFEIVKNHLDESISSINYQLQDDQRKLESLELECARYPIQYPGIDEPIRRFLLYGGTVSEKYLVNSVNLLARSRSNDIPADFSMSALPEWFIQRLQKWWGAHREILDLNNTDSEFNPSTGERYRTPKIFLDIASREVVAMLPAQRFLHSKFTAPVMLEVFADESKEPFRIIENIKLYAIKNGLVETNPTEKFPLMAPSDKFLFRLVDKENLIHEWDLPGVDEDEPFLAFSSSSFERINGDVLPRTSLFLIIKEKQTISPPACILTEGSTLFGPWKKFRWYELDLNTIEELYISCEEGCCTLIPLRSDPCNKIALVGGQQLLEVYSCENPVYTIPPEKIRIPIADQNDLYLIRFSIISENQNSRHFQVGELENINNFCENGFIEIPLNDEKFLGKVPLGCYTLRLYKAPFLDWQASICVIPGFKVSFEHEIYVPYRESNPEVKVSLTIPDFGKFLPEAPAREINGKTLNKEVATPANENEITGIFKAVSHSEETIFLQLSIKIPKLRWRLQGYSDSLFDQWFSCFCNDELWIGDWLKTPELFLQLELPRLYEGNISLVLPENSIPFSNNKLQDHKIRFDLKALEDALRAGPSLLLLSVALENHRINIPDIPLFSLRTRWQAEKMKCFYFPEDNDARIDVTWDEKGKADQIAARLWFISETKQIPMPEAETKRILIQEKVFASGESKITFRTNRNEIKSGNYLVHLESINPFSQPATCPKLNDPNTQIIEINIHSEERAVTLRRIKVLSKHTDRYYNLQDDSYRIVIIGKVTNQQMPENIDSENCKNVLITPMNENWFVGNLEVIGIPRVVKHLADTNPVKFEYDSAKGFITSIEDRHGDGAVYCYDCKMLFWNQETIREEIIKNHRNYGPIEEFRVDWENHI